MHLQATTVFSFLEQKKQFVENVEPFQSAQVPYQ
jgi:hypothetical protein